MKPQTVQVWPCAANPTATYQGTDHWSLHHTADWFSRMAWRFLQWRKALQPYLLRVDTWTFHPQQQGPLNEAILEAIERSYADMPRVRDGDFVVIMGTSTFKEFTQSPAFRECMTFHTGPFGSHHPYRGREVYGLPLHVVPGMQGLAVVPRAIVEKVKG